MPSPQGPAAHLQQHRPGIAEVVHPRSRSVKEAFAAARQRLSHLRTMLGVNAVDYRAAISPSPRRLCWVLRMGAHREAGMRWINRVHPHDRDGAVAECGVAAATLLFEAVRQRQAARLIPTEGEGLSPELFHQTPVRVGLPPGGPLVPRHSPGASRPQRRRGILGKLPRTVKLRC